MSLSASCKKKPAMKARKAASDIRYQIILAWSTEDDAFIAQVPELPGCMADGATYQEALANAEVVIRDWLETARELGRAVPKPHGRPVDEGGRTPA